MKEIIFLVVTRVLASVPMTPTHDDYLSMCDHTDKKEPIDFDFVMEEQVETTYVVKTDCARSDEEILEYVKKGFQNAGHDIVSIAKK